MRLRPFNGQSEVQDDVESHTSFVPNSLSGLASITVGSR